MTRSTGTRWSATLLWGLLALVAPPRAHAQAPGRTPDPEAEVGASDVRAGLTSVAFDWRGTGRFERLAGEVPAPGNGLVQRVAFEVETGLSVDAEVFAEFVLAVLNDDRGWGRDGEMTFARTEGPADVVVTLASPATSHRLCGHLNTGGYLSCAVRGRAVLTMYRWVLGVEYFGEAITKYRRYLVNHEVGHVLGHGHAHCPRRGALAPVMVQQTKSLEGCRPNGWPFPDVAPVDAQVGARQ